MPHIIMSCLLEVWVAFMYFYNLILRLRDYCKLCYIEIERWLDIHLLFYIFALTASESVNLDKRIQFASSSDRTTRCVPVATHFTSRYTTLLLRGLRTTHPVCCSLYVLMCARMSVCVWVCVYTHYCWLTADLLCECICVFVCIVHACVYVCMCVAYVVSACFNYFLLNSL